MLNTWPPGRIMMLDRITWSVTLSTRGAISPILRSLVENFGCPIKEDIGKISISCWDIHPCSYLREHVNKQARMGCDGVGGMQATSDTDTEPELRYDFLSIFCLSGELMKRTSSGRILAFHQIAPNQDPVG